MIFRLLLLLPLLANAAAAPAPPDLRDQYGNTGGLADYSNEPVLVLVAAPRKLRWIGRWEETIRAEIPALRSIRVADITDEPRPDESRVAETLRKRVPDNVSILIDLDNEWAGLYELDTREPCLVLLDDKHQPVARFRGRPKGALTEEVLTTLQDYFPADSDAKR